jgi:hypothetical protein
MNPRDLGGLLVAEPDKLLAIEIYGIPIGWFPIGW